MTVGELCGKLRNYFTPSVDRHPGSYRISQGVLSPCDFLSPGQYFRIIGSRANDGVYKNASGLSLTDEEFSGCVWAMRVPPEIETIVSEISAWEEKYGDAAESPYSFESFGGYSYSKPAHKTDAVSLSQFGWWGAFASRLAPWRKQDV